MKTCLRNRHRVGLRRATVGTTLARSIALAGCLLAAPTAHAATFYQISGITSSTAGNDLWPASNLIQGPEVGFDALEPHDKLLTGDQGNWVTAAPGGFPSDYIAVAGPPVLVIDLGADVPLGEISIWGYTATNANGASEVALRFATDAEGPEGLGTSIAYNPSFLPLNDEFFRQSFEFDETVVARYVEVTCVDNFFDESGVPPGGDRVGLGEIAFAVSTGGNAPSIVTPASVRLALSGAVQDFDIPILNTGVQTLEITGTSFSGPNDNQFEVVNFPNFVDSLETENLVIRFTPIPGVEDDVEALLEIASNDPDKPSVFVQLDGSFPQFHEIASVTTFDSEFFPVANLIQGPGVGFDANPPHDSLAAGDTGAWVTDACGFPCDYYDTFPPPVLFLDLGADVLLTEISVWGYATTNANGVKDFSLRFATDADGPDGFGTSITYNPEFNEIDFDQVPRQSRVFDQPITARYVEFTCIDNYFFPPGDGSTGGLPGGDRVGLSEIAFEKARVNDTPTVEAPFSVDLALDGTVQEFEIPVRNTGTPALTIANARFTGTDASAFSVVSAPTDVDTYFLESIVIGFNPAGLAGPVSAALEFDTNDPGSPVAAVQLAGILHDPMAVADAVNAFGPFTEGAGPQAIVVPVANGGATQPLNITGVTVGGANAANFVVDSLTTPIAPNTAGAVNLTFDAQGAFGPFSATLTIDSDDPVTPSIVITVGVQVAPANPLIALWTLDADASDATGNGHDGDPPQNVVFGQPGANGSTGTSALFDGTEGIHVPYDPAINPDSFTLTAWVRPSSTFDWNSVVTNREDNGASVNGFILYNNPEAAWDFWTGAGGPAGAWQRTIGPAATLDTWQHLAISFDRTTSTKKLYVDGTNVAENVQGYTPNGTTPETARPLNIGSGQDFGDGFFFTGNIDDVALFSVALSQEEIMGIMNNGASSFLNLAPFQITAINRAENGTVTITFNSRPGLLYLIERSTNLSTWEEIDDSVASEGESTDYSDAFPPAGADSLYYRVLEP